MLQGRNKIREKIVPVAVLCACILGISGCIPMDVVRNRVLDQAEQKLKDATLVPLHERKIVPVAVLCACILGISGCIPMDVVRNRVLDQAEQKLKDATLVPLHERLEEAVEEGADLDHFSVLNGTGMNGTYETNPIQIGIYNMVDRYTIQRLLEAGADANAYNAEGDPLIFNSARKDDLKMYDLFVSGGADVTAQNEAGDTLLEYYLSQREAKGTALNLARRNFVKKMLEQGCPVRKRTIEMAEKTGNYQILDLLYEVLPESKDDLARRNFVKKMLEQGCPVRKRTIEMAEKTGNYQILDLLYEVLPESKDELLDMERLFLDGKIKEANRLMEKARDWTDDEICLAVAYGDRETVRILADRGIEFGREETDRPVLLYLAVYYGNLETFSGMMDHMKEWTQGESRETLLRAVFINDATECMEYLCESGWIRAEEITDQEMMYLAYNGAEHVLSCVVSHGYDFSEHKEAGNQAFTQAVLSENIEMLQALFACGADPDVHSEKQDSPMVACGYWGDPKMLRLFLEQGADVKAVGEDVMLCGADPDVHSEKQDSPMVACGYWGDPKMLRLFLEQGADVKAVGEDVMFSAVTSENLDVVKILREAGVGISENAYTGAKENSGYENSHTWEYVKAWYEKCKRG